MARKGQTFINLFKQGPDGTSEHFDRFEVDIHRTYEVIHDKKKGGAVIRFYPLGSDDFKEFRLGGTGLRWSLGFRPAAKQGRGTSR